MSVADVINGNTNRWARWRPATIGVEATPSLVAFTPRHFGYARVPYQRITVRNTGSQPIRLDNLQAVPQFTITQAQNWNTQMINYGETRTFDVRPLDNLRPGTHVQTIQIRAGGILRAVVVLRFVVTTNVNLHLYYGGHTSATEVTSIARDAARPFRSTFYIDMSISTRSVNIDHLRRYRCPSGLAGHCMLCLRPPHLRLSTFGSDALLPFLRGVTNNSTSGLHTLFFDGVLYLTCNPPGGYMGAAQFNHVLVTSTDEHFHAMGVDFIPKRVAQHEWSHSYGIHFEPWVTSPCTQRCIMMGEWSDDPSEVSNIWCRRCRDIILPNQTRTTWPRP